jgi:hypothetical protein
VEATSEVEYWCRESRPLFGDFLSQEPSATRSTSKYVAGLRRIVDYVLRFGHSAKAKRAKTS